MNLKNNVNSTENLLIIKECLIDYVGPIFIFGNIEWLLEGDNVTIISATTPKEELVILNGKVPKWVTEVKNKTNRESNILIIKDIEKISIEKQELLLDILENNEVSSERLPNNLKIILNAGKICEINHKVRDIVECYEI